MNTTIDRTCIHPWHVAPDGYPTCKGDGACRGRSVGCGLGGIDCPRHDENGERREDQAGKPAYFIRPSCADEIGSKEIVYVILWTGNAGRRVRADFAPITFPSAASAQEFAFKLGYAINLND